MAGTSRNPKVVAGRIAVDVEAIQQASIPVTHWSRLERLLGSAIPAAARERIVAHTCLLARSSPALRRTVTVKQATTAIKKWQTATKSLMGVVWEMPHDSKLAPNWITQFTVQKLAARIAKGTEQPLLQDLAMALRLALAQSEHTVRAITAHDFPGRRDYDAWALWAAMIAEILNEHNISVAQQTHAGAKLRPQFVDFIEALQSYLPSRIRKKKGDSVRRSLNDAHRAAAPLTYEELWTLFETWIIKGDVTTASIARSSLHDGFGPEFDILHTSRRRADAKKK